MMLSTPLCLSLLGLGDLGDLELSDLLYALSLHLPPTRVEYPLSLTHDALEPPLCLSLLSLGFSGFRASDLLRALSLHLPPTRLEYPLSLTQDALPILLSLISKPAIGIYSNCRFGNQNLFTQRMAVSYSRFVKKIHPKRRQTNTEAERREPHGVRRSSINPDGRKCGA